VLNEVGKLSGVGIGRDMEGGLFEGIILIVISRN
jgi:hypothetical protein